MGGDAAQLVPGLTTIDGADVTHVHRVQRLRDLLARHRGVVGEIHHVRVATGHGLDVAEQEIVVVARGLGQHAFDVEHHHQAPVGELGDCGDQAAEAGGEHLGRHAHLRPVQAQDGVDALDQEALGVAVVFGDDHDLALRIGTHAGIGAQVNHRDQRTAQTDHALHRVRHVGRGGDRRRAHDLAHLEDVDAEGLAAAGACIHAQREQQDFELVRARKPGAGVDVLEQFGHVFPPCGRLRAQGVRGVFRWISAAFAPT